MILDDIPGYREAVQREAKAREAACVGVSREVAGVPLRQMTLEDYLLLDAINSPFICGGYIMRMDCLKFLAFLWEGYQRPSDSIVGRWMAKRRNAKVLRMIGERKIEEIITAINAYTDEMFLDSPASSKAPGAQYPSVASFGASIIDSLGSYYGWTPQEIRSQPLPLIFQLMRLRYISMGGQRSSVINRLSSKVAGDYIRSLNSGLN